MTILLAAVVATSLRQTKLIFDPDLNTDGAEKLSCTAKFRQTVGHTDARL